MFYKENENKIFLWQQFFPLDYVTGAERKGIGTLAHTKSLLKLYYSGITLDFITRHNFKHITDERRLHLQKTGITNELTFKDYLQKSVGYAKSKGFQFKEYKTKQF